MRQAKKSRMLLVAAGLGVLAAASALLVLRFAAPAAGAPAAGVADQLKSLKTHIKNLPTVLTAHTSHALLDPLDAARIAVQDAKDPCPNLDALAYAVLQQRAENGITASEAADLSSQVAVINAEVPCPTFVLSGPQTADLGLIALQQSIAALSGTAPPTKKQQQLADLVERIRRQIANIAGGLDPCNPNGGLPSLALLILQQHADGYLTDAQQANLSSQVAAIMAVLPCPPLVLTTSQQAGLQLSSLRTTVLALPIGGAPKTALKDDIDLARAENGSGANPCPALVQLTSLIATQAAAGKLTPVENVELTAAVVAIRALFPPGSGC